MKVFLVQHAYYLEEEEEIKIIGIYSTQDKAEEAIAKLRSQPGFQDTPKDFYIDTYTMDQDHWSEGYVTVRNTDE